MQSAGRRAPYYSLWRVPWPSQPTPYASAFTAHPAWPMYMPSYMYMPRPPPQQAFMQAEFEKLARQRQDLEACEIKVQRMTRTHNLNAVRDAGVATATSVAGSRHSLRKEQAPRHAASQIASQRSRTPSGAPPSRIEVISTGISQTVTPPPVSSQDGASQEVKAMVLPDTTWSYLLQDTTTQSQAQSSNEDPEPLK